MKEKNTRVGVAMVVKSPVGYILLRRKGSHGAGSWSLPGGHLEFGETVKDCAIRECLEELGVVVNPDSVKNIPYFSEDFFLDVDKHYITLYLYGETLDSPKIMEPDKADMMFFFDKNDSLPENLFCGTGNAWKTFLENNLTI